MKQKAEEGEGDHRLTLLTVTPLHDEEEVTRLFRQIVEGLEHIHGKGMIHRNILCRRTK
jgi:serine/threonine protein kinase